VFIAEFSISKTQKRVSTEKREEAVQWLLGALLKNGQILDDYQCTEDSNSYFAFASLPARDALDSSHNNEYVQKCYTELKEAGLRQPRIRVRGSAESVCECPKNQWFILFTQFLSIQSPLNCGKCFRAVPLYRIPHLSGGEYLDVRHWQADYKACDTLQMHCGTGRDRFGTRQMSEVNSSLSKEGITLCRAIEKATRKPTYYYLYRYTGRGDEYERNRKCPSCGGEWLLKKRLHRLFDFRCRQCRLLSQIAFGS
jgi:predicted  nucleic acid-binding Zn ribbon protein